MTEAKVKRTAVGWRGGLLLLSVWLESGIFDGRHSVVQHLAEKQRRDNEPKRDSSGNMEKALFLGEWVFQPRKLGFE